MDDDAILAALGRTYDPLTYPSPSVQIETGKAVCRSARPLTPAQVVAFLRELDEDTPPAQAAQVLENHGARA